jgi:hypothetical protein
MTWEDIITHGVEDRELTEWRGSVQSPDECDATKVK